MKFDLHIGKGLLEAYRCRHEPECARALSHALWHVHLIVGPLLLLCTVGFSWWMISGVPHGVEVAATNGAAASGLSNQLKDALEKIVSRNDRFQTAIQTKPAFGDPGGGGAGSISGQQQTPDFFVIQQPQ